MVEVAPDGHCLHDAVSRLLRYAALTHQRIDVELAVRAVIDASDAPSAVERSLSVHGRAEYVRASMGRPNWHP